MIESPHRKIIYAMFKEIKDKGIAEYPITADGSTTRLGQVFLIMPLV